MMKQMLSRIASSLTPVILSDLYDPQTFDLIKDNLDQSAFYALYENHSTDPIVQCRKAELLIRLANDDEALQLLEDNPSLLALGIKTRAFAALSKFDIVDEIAARDYHPVSELDLEGIVHIKEIAGISAYTKGDFAEALRLIEWAIDIAKHIHLKNRIRVMETHREVLLGKLNRPLDHKPIEVTGNIDLARYQLYTRWKTLMITGKFNQAAQLQLNNDLSAIATATHHYHQLSYFRASQVLKNQPKELEHQLFFALLKLQIFAKINDVSYANPIHAIRMIKGLESSLPNFANVLITAKEPFALGVMMLIHLLPQFSSMKNLIPSVTNARYRDGIHLDGKLIAVLPNSIRKALDHERTKHETMLPSVSRQYRYRANTALKKVDLELWQCLTQSEINQALERLTIALK
jgi:tetratricopeptide (TPR) repeat protein